MQSSTSFETRAKESFLAESNDQFLKFEQQPIKEQSLDFPEYQQNYYNNFTESNKSLRQSNLQNQHSQYNDGSNQYQECQLDYSNNQKVRSSHTKDEQEEYFSGDECELVEFDNNFENKIILEQFDHNDLENQSYIQGQNATNLDAFNKYANFLQNNLNRSENNYLSNQDISQKQQQHESYSPQQLHESQIFALYENIRQLVSNRPLSQVLHVLFNKHVLKKTDEEIFGSTQYLKSQDQYIGNGLSSMVPTDFAKNVCITDFKKVAKSFVVYGYSENVRLKSFSYISKQKYQHIMATIAQTIWKSTINMIAESNPGQLRQVSGSQIKIIRRQIILYKQWMSPQNILILVQISKFKFSLDDPRKIKIPEIQKIIKFYQELLYRLRIKQKQEYKKNIEGGQSSISNDNRSRTNATINLYRQMQSSQPTTQRLSKMQPIQLQLKLPSKNQKIESTAQNFKVESLASNQYNNISYGSSYGNAGEDQKIKPWQRRYMNQIYYDKKTPNQYQNSQNAYPVPRGQFQMSYNDQNADEEDYSLPGLFPGKHKQMPRPNIQQGSRQLKDWNSTKSPLNNGINRLETFGPKGPTINLKRGQELMQMGYDDNKSVQDYDETVRNTQEQASLSSYSKSKMKNKKIPASVDLDSDNSVKVKKVKKQYISDPNNPSIEPGQDYWTQQTTKQFLKTYIFKPTLNNIKDHFNQIENMNNIKFEYNHIKSKFNKMIRICVRLMIMRRQEFQEQCSKKDEECRLPLIIKLKDDKIKTLMSTPAAQQARIEMFRLYLSPKNDIMQLEQTINTVNQFVRNVFGESNDYEPVVGDVIQMNGVLATLSPTLFKDATRTQQLQTLDEEYKKAIKGNHRNQKYDDDDLSTSNLNKIIMEETRKLYKGSKGK